MIKHHLFESQDLPENFKCQILSFMRVEWFEEFQGENRLRSDEFLRSYLAVAPILAHELSGLIYYKTLFWARQAKYFASRLATNVTLGDASPDGNARHFAKSRQELERLLAVL
jgi:hypothetical protein